MDEINKKDLLAIQTIEVEDGLLDLEYESDFNNMLEEDSITPEWIQENAVWLQLDTEPDEAYTLFKEYVRLPIDKWKPNNMSKNAEELELIKKCFTKFEWKKRRLLYIKYQDWFEKKRQEMEHLNAISLYRQNQATILGDVSSSALTLVDKLRQKIDSIEPDDIKVSSLPTFISALSTFISLASDAQARALAVDKLLKLHAEELSALKLQEHIQYVNEHKEELDV